MLPHADEQAARLTSTPTPDVERAWAQAHARRQRGRLGRPLIADYGVITFAVNTGVLKFGLAAGGCQDMSCGAPPVSLWSTKLIS